VGSPLADLVRRALEEDHAFDDVTTKATVPDGAQGRALLVSRSRCIVAGMDGFVETFRALDEASRVDVRIVDGQVASNGDVIAAIDGSLRAILSGERTALNLVQHLSGIATLTREFVDAVGGRATVKDTRKTTPGLRALEKAAVRAGGGTNHRSDLSAAILIKDNHIVAAGGIEPAVRSAKDTGVWVEVECDSLDQVRAAIEAGADEILLDNMDLATLRAAVDLVKGRARLEASGGITLKNIGEISATGVDSISVGALTHSAPAADLSLEVEAI